MSRAPIRGGLHGTAVPDSKKKSFDDYCCFSSTFCEAEWNDPPNRSNSLKSIGFMCKSNNGIVNYLLNRICFLLVFVDGFALQGRSVKAPETYELFKSIGNMYKNNTSRLSSSWWPFHFLLVSLSNSYQILTLSH